MEKNSILSYFRTNLYESYQAYNAWKIIAFSKSKGLLSEEMAEKYVEIQKYHPNFFMAAEHAFLVNFIMLILHSFDKYDDSHSLCRVDENETENFIKDNVKVIGKLKKARNKIFAHRDIKKDPKNFPIPSLIDLDDFFKNLFKFYNRLCSKIESSFTYFTNAEEIKRDIENLFINLYRGELNRKNKIEIKYLWEENTKKISDII